MLYAVIAQAVIILTLLAILYSFESSNRAERQDRAQAHDQALQKIAESIASEREAWATERAELLNRIQRPDFTPPTVPQAEIPEQEPDESALVGHIEYDENYGLEDETFGNPSLDGVTSG